MNTITEWKTIAKIHDPKRLATWSKIFNGDTIPIKSIFPQIVNLPGHPNALIYFLDLEAITDEQRKQLTLSISDKFNLPVPIIEDDIDEAGVPILAEDVTVSTTDQGLFLSMLD